MAIDFRAGPFWVDHCEDSDVEKLQGGSEEMELKGETGWKPSIYCPLYSCEAVNSPPQAKDNGVFGNLYTDNSTIRDRDDSVPHRPLTDSSCKLGEF